VLKGRVAVMDLWTGRKDGCRPTMSLTFMIWVCTLPLVLFLVTPFFG
jgi:hypothetical protein